MNPFHNNTSLGLWLTSVTALTTTALPLLSTYFVQGTVLSHWLFHFSQMFLTVTI